jgi:16S rRNA (guanine1207-N2)-methyltransferase
MATPKDPSKPEAEESEGAHYFIREPAVPSAPRELQVKLRGLSLQLTTDRGVFSHGQLDPGTRVLAEHMQIPPGAEVLDLGCGYGVLGIVAGLLCPSCRVTMVDVNARACRLAEDNARANGLRNARVICGDAREVLAGQKFDLILCNPPVRAGREVVLSLLAWSATALKPHGELWAVIHTNKGARRYARDLQQWFGRVETVRIKGGYRVLRACEPRSR